MGGGLKKDEGKCVEELNNPNEIWKVAVELLCELRLDPAKNCHS